MYCGPDNSNSNFENHGIYIDGPGSYEIAYSQFTKIRGGNGVQVYSLVGNVDDVSIHHNVIKNIGKHGINITDGARNNIAIWNNIVTDTDVYGLRLASTALLRGARVYNNTFFNDLIAGIPGGAYNAVISNTDANLTTTNIDIRNNIIWPRSSSTPSLHHIKA